MSGSTNTTEHVCSLLLVGDVSVGKTCLIYQFVRNAFKSDTTNTIASDFYNKEVTIKQKLVKVQVWDTSGQERFQAITRSLYRNKDGIVIVYDMTERSSFKNLPYWIEEIKRHGEDDVEIMLLGNKSDMKNSRLVTKVEAQKFAREYGIPFFETSAKERVVVQDAFLDLIHKINNKNSNKFKRNAEERSQLLQLPKGKQRAKGKTKNTGKKEKAKCC